MTGQWVTGDKQPPNSEVRQVRGASGQIWHRSPPNGLFWYPRGGGLTRDWTEVLDLDGPVTADDTTLPLTLFSLGEVAS